jgi:hypothetical protein
MRIGDKSKHPFKVVSAPPFNLRICLKLLPSSSLNGTSIKNTPTLQGALVTGALFSNSISHCEPKEQFATLSSIGLLYLCCRHPAIVSDKDVTTLCKAKASSYFRFAHPKQRPHCEVLPTHVCLHPTNYSARQRAYNYKKGYSTING